MTSLQIDIDDSEVQQLIGRLTGRMSLPAMRYFMHKKVHPVLAESTAARFESEGDSASGKWQALAYATGRIRAGKGFPAWHPINVRTGALRALVTKTYTVNAVGAGGIALTMPGPAGGELGRKLRTAQIGSGTKTTRGQLRPLLGPSRPSPARPVVAITQRDSERISDALFDYINAAGR